MAHAQRQDGMLHTMAQHKPMLKKSGHPESNQGPSDCCKFLQSDALPAELWPACVFTSAASDDNFKASAHGKQVLKENDLHAWSLDLLEQLNALIAADLCCLTYKNVLTRSRAWVVAATTRRPNH